MVRRPRLQRLFVVFHRDGVFDAGPWLGAGRFRPAVGRHHQAVGDPCPLHRGGSGRFQGGRVDQEPGPGILKLELKFRRSKPGVERDEDGAQQAAGEEGLHEGRVVLPQVRHPVPLGHSAAPECVGQAVGPLGQFLIAKGAGSGNEGCLGT